MQHILTIPFFLFSVLNLVAGYPFLVSLAMFFDGNTENINIEKDKRRLSAKTKEQVVTELVILQSRWLDKHPQLQESSMRYESHNKLYWLQSLHWATKTFECFMMDEVFRPVRDVWNDYISLQAVQPEVNCIAARSQFEKPILKWINRRVQAVLTKHLQSHRMTEAVLTL